MFQHDPVDGIPAGCREIPARKSLCSRFACLRPLVKYLDKSHGLQHTEAFFSRVQEEGFGKGEMEGGLDSFQELLCLLDVLGVVHVQYLAQVAGLQS